MEHSIIALVVYSAAVVAMAICFIWCMVKDFGGEEPPLRNLHFTPPPSSPGTWQTPTEAESAPLEPWFLVVYADAEEKHYTVFPVEDIQHVKVNVDDGAVTVYCKTDIGYSDNMLCFTDIYRYEFVPASEIGAYLFKEK